MGEERRGAEGVAESRRRSPPQPPHAERERTPVGTAVSCGGASHPGSVRAVNQDSFWMGEVVGKGTLGVVADGMGGHQTGEIASQQAVSVFRKAFARSKAHPPAALARAAQAANLEIYAHALEHPESRGMGTTLTAVFVDDQVALVGHVGDSRAYLVRGGLIDQLTHDHSWVADRVRQGLLTDEEARRHRWRNVITNALGATATFRLDLQHLELRPGDRILLCSDGVSMVLPDALMMAIVERYEPQEAADRLIAAANERGSPDNVTAVVLRVDRLDAKSKRYAVPEEAEPSSIDITETLSGIRKVEDAFPEHSLRTALRQQPWYPYRLWLAGSLALLLALLVLAVRGS
jgi:PPM family protein phosphatase